MRVLLIAPHYDKNTPGESWSTYKWVQGISEHFETTVLTTHKRHWQPESSPVQAKEIVNWIDPTLPRFMRRLEWELKPTYLLFYRRARRWLQEQKRRGVTYDLIHQINPLALRYPSPAYDLGVRYLMGPLAGSLATPLGFREECKDRQWYRKLRQVDGFRIRHDPWMKKTYEQAAVVLGVAPYVQDVLCGLKIQSFKIMSETGVESVADTPKRGPAPGAPLKLLFVGRVIRTKGVIDAIRAVGRIMNKANVEFNIVGDGDMMGTCKSEVEHLGLSRIVHFHGRLPRSEVTRWYQQSHVFLFPSFREPSGNVVYEAMGQGLPIIAADYGGPGYSVTDAAGVRVAPSSPVEFVKNLSERIADAFNNPTWVEARSRGALARVKELAYWPEKIRSLVDVYNGKDVIPNIEPR